MRITYSDGGMLVQPVFAFYCELGYAEYTFEDKVFTAIQKDDAYEFELDQPECSVFSSVSQIEFLYGQNTTIVGFKPIEQIEQKEENLIEYNEEMLKQTLLKNGLTIEEIDKLAFDTVVEHKNIIDYETALLIICERRKLL
jgi:hypothetical protein